MKCCALFYFLFLSQILAAQTVRVSEPINVKNDFAYEIIGKYGDRYLLFRDKGDEFEVQAFNEQLRPTWNKELVLEKRRPAVLAVVGLGSDFAVIYEHRKRGRTIVRANRYDRNAELIDSVTVADYGIRYEGISLEIKVAEDKKSVLIHHLENSRTLNAIAFHLGKMERLWEQNFAVGEYLYDETDYHLLFTNDADAFVIYDENNRRSKKEDHHFKVFHWDAAAGALRNFRLGMGELLTFDAKFSYDNTNRRLMGAGLFSEKNLTKTNGWFFLSCDPARTDTFQLFHERFDENFVSTLLGKEVDEPRGVADYNVRHIVHRRDGGILLIAEKVRKFERNNSSAGRPFTRGRGFITDYYFDDIFAISIHPDGRTHWKTVLHKRQYSQDDDAIFSGFFLVRTPANLRFIFNDEISNENTVSEYVLDSTGEYDRNSVVNTDNLDLRIRFRDALQVSTEEVVAPSERRSRLKLVSVRY